MHEQRPDRGYTLIEVLLVIVVLGLLATIVAIAAGGITTQAGASGCNADLRTLHTAVESYFMQYATDTIPPAPMTEHAADTYEQSLVGVALLHSPSRLHDVAGDGTVTVAPGSPCAA